MTEGIKKEADIEVEDKDAEQSQAVKTVWVRNTVSVCASARQAKNKPKMIKDEGRLLNSAMLIMTANKSILKESRVRMSPKPQNKRSKKRKQN
ncbi:hypothetical protein VMCG_04823 [Cytospora schulzeri]|uniref:Uncharacterized protein n=1 Tax=Cytospora schulzeri TaxID=448051 RepID=A0A423WNB4_9PEZI|nr:hypothetical protein VMCG_04823 [Valsa malicola]